MGWVDWVVFFEELMSLKCRVLGEEMATILMIAVGPVTNIKSFQFSVQTEVCRAPVATILGVGTVDLSSWRISILRQSGEIRLSVRVL